MGGQLASLKAGHPVFTLLQPQTWYPEVTPCGQLRAAIRWDLALNSHAGGRPCQPLQPQHQAVGAHVGQPAPARTAGQLGQGGQQTEHQGYAAGEQAVLNGLFEPHSLQEVTHGHSAELAQLEALVFQVCGGGGGGGG